MQLGVLFGLATGIYWAGNNAFIYLSTNDNNRDNYYAINSSIGSILSIISPLVGGIVLSQAHFLPQLKNSNYYLLFSLVISIFLFGFYCTRKLPKEFIPKITLKQTLSPFKVRVWQIAGLSAFIEGFKGGCVGFIATILTFQILTKEMNMAIYSSAFSLLSAVVSYLLIGRLNRKNRLKYGFLGALLLIFVNVTFVYFFFRKRDYFKLFYRSFCKSSFQYRSRLNFLFNN